MILIHELKKCYESLSEQLNGDSPVFISRIGGSDTDAVVDYQRAKDVGAVALQGHVTKHMRRASEYNGFYCLGNSPVEVYFQYCEELIRSYRQSRRLMFCNSELLSMYFRDLINPQFYKETFENKKELRLFVKDLAENNSELICYPYNFVERIVLDENTLFQVFSSVLEQKRVLVVSPFSASIKANFHQRHGFFKRGYRYPEFSLGLVDTPITYSGIPATQYPHANWIETKDSLIRQVSEVEFDIALLSCGSYAMPLGVHIERKLKRKAVYVGGVLQLYFGVMGRRYMNTWFTDQINVDSFILPIERERYLSLIPTNDVAAREAFGAYF